MHDNAAIPTPADPARQPKLLERMRIHLRTRHYSIRTEEAYIDWARRFILFHGKRHPQGMGAVEVEAFLSHLALDRQVSASTQNQAKAAILYLSKSVFTISTRVCRRGIGRSALLQILAIARLLLRFAPSSPSRSASCAPSRKIVNTL
jgi:hypothetical protein